MLKKQLVILALGALTLSVGAADLKTQKDKNSYAVGVVLGNQIKNFDISADVVVQAIKDVMGGKKLKLDNKQIQSAMQNLQAQRHKAMQEMAKKNKTAGETFLSKNKKKKGVKTLKNGIQYKIVKNGKGKSPKKTDTVVVHYKGELIDGKEFDSSYKRGQPATFKLNQVIKGWQEVLPLMKEGAKWKVFIPSDLAYGMRGSPPNIPPNSTLVFDIELKEIKG